MIESGQVERGIVFIVIFIVVVLFQKGILQRRPTFEDGAGHVTKTLVVDSECCCASKSSSTSLLLLWEDDETRACGGGGCRRCRRMVVVW